MGHAVVGQFAHNVMRFAGKEQTTSLNLELLTWIVSTFGIPSFALRDLGLRDAEDPEIFEAARNQNVILMTKDSDFVDLVERLGAPPQIIWLTCGNTSNDRLQTILTTTLPEVLGLLQAGETLVEISGK